MIKEQHESYGMMQISRSHYSGNVSLFGSSIEHNNVIRLRISKGEVDRHLNNDWYYASPLSEDTFVEVEMSYTQFAEAITSLNMGAGVPVTIRQQGEQRFERPPYQAKDEQFKGEYESSVKNLIESVRDGMETVDELLAQKKPLNKADKEEISSVLSNTFRVLTDHIPFMKKMFEEQMDKTTLEAKGEIEAFLQNKINQIAMSAIGENHENFIAESKNMILADHSDIGSTEPIESEIGDEEQEFEDESFGGMTMGMEMK